MLKYVLLLILVFGYAVSLAAPNNIDSLVSLLARTPKNEQYVRILNQLAFQYRESDGDTTLLYANQAKELAKNIKFEQGLGEAISHIAWVSFRRNDLVVSFDLTTQAYNLGIKVKDTILQINCINTIAGIYRFQKKYQEAKTILHKAIDLSNKIGSKQLEIRCLANITQIFLENNELDSASYYVNNALRLIPKIENPYYIIGVYRNVSDIAFAKKEYDKAIQYYKLCIAMAKEKKLHYSHLASVRRMAQVYIAKGEDKTAVGLLEEAIDLGKEYELFEDLSLAYRLLAAANARQKNFDKAYMYEVLYSKLSDSLDEIRLNDKIALVEKEFELERSNNRIINLAEQNELKQAKIKEQQYVILSIVLLGIFLTLFVIILINNQKNNKRAYNIMARQRDEITEKNKINEEQSQKLAQANNLKSKLFAIIGHDLRSPVGSLRSIFDLLEDEMLTQEEFYVLSLQLRKNVDGVYSTLNNLLLWAQIQMNGIKSLSVEININQMVERKMHIFQPIAKQKQIGIENKVQAEMYIYVDENQIESVLRNLINNAIKFTPRNGKIVIEAREYDSDFVQIAIADTGIGMEKDKLASLFIDSILTSTKGTDGESGTGLGLLLCKEFIENNGGKIWAESAVGKGTTFYFTVRKGKSI
ncbi:MAG: hypothetical protein EAZ08_00555 [Cytophagales bacterium]|nr:MAG: hypothetical protein EAZ08_00555 [Cytophagales bacterium]